MLDVDIEKKLSSFTLRIRFSAEGASALVGPSGCGKSVTLKCIAGIMKPDRGRIAYNGRVLFDSGQKDALSEHFLKKNLLLPIPSSEIDANSALTNADNNYGY